ncbi:MAG TPA: type III polyketide synthase [Sphingomonas sp.]|nr:type III polyketide synthase [Sphingomonas sp.]
MTVEAHLNRIGTAVPPNDVHDTYLHWAGRRLDDTRDRALFDRMAGRAGIAHRWSVLAPPESGGSQTDRGGFYGGGAMPSTAQRMAVYAEAAPDLCLAAVDALGRPAGVTHLVLASCTGFVAPGIDQIVAQRLGLAADVERTLIGFMGCYAAVAALRAARHIVRSDPQARVLVITVELCSLHLQPRRDLEAILAMMLFGDGAAAALVTADPEGLTLTAPFAQQLPDSEKLIGWTIGDTGFAMHLSGAVPGRIGQALATPDFRALLGDPAGIDGWAVHAGGRSVLDAVEHALALDARALSASRAVLSDNGNMSSATLMFVLDRILAERRRIDNGLAIAFGPGLAAEGFRFGSPA